MAEVPAPSARAPFRVQAGGCHPTASPSERRAENSNPTVLPAARFPPGPAAWLVHPPRAEGDRLERYGVTRASASNGARPLGRFTFHECAGRESNPHARRHRLLRSARLPVTPPAHVQGRHGAFCIPSGYRESDPGLHHGKVMRCHYATSAGFVYRRAFAADFALQQTSHLHPSL
jgi:hypothetical protein